MSRGQTDRVLEHIRRMRDEESLDRLTDRELLRRFAVSNEESAFAVLVRRHGPMVQQVCCRVLRNWHDAEDALQATFLVLARKAGERGWRESVAGWLHRTAARIARKVRLTAARRRSHEARAQERRTGDPLAEITGRELLAALDEELERLPEKYRAALVLCCLEGDSREEAARRLGVPPATVKNRLEAGRAALQARLARRGLPLSAALTAALLAGGNAAAALPAALVDSTVRAAKLFALGAGVDGCPAAVTAARAALGGLLPGKAKCIALLASLVLIAVPVAGMRWVLQPAPPDLATDGAEMAKFPDPGRRRSAEGRRENPAVRGVPAGPTQRLTGRVLDEAGRPVPHARVAVLAREPFSRARYILRDEILCQGRADEKGCFRLAVPADFPTWSPEDRRVKVIAWARGWAPRALDEVSLRAGAPEVELRLRAGHVIQGRLIGADGRAAAGVKVHVTRVGPVEPRARGRAGRLARTGAHRRPRRLRLPRPRPGAGRLPASARRPFRPRVGGLAEGRARGIHHHPEAAPLPRRPGRGRRHALAAGWRAPTHRSRAERRCPNPRWVPGPDQRRRALPRTPAGRGPF
jgi:RNA polymerase sigma factor (sigma-70 family)